MSIRDVYVMMAVRVDRTANPHTGEVRETALSERVLGATFSRIVARQALQQIAFDAAQPPVVRMSYLTDGALESLEPIPDETATDIDAIMALVESR